MESVALPHPGIKTNEYEKERFVIHPPAVRRALEQFYPDIRGWFLRVLPKDRD